MRPFDEEMKVRKEQRQRYFEDENYRKWSDVISNDRFGSYEGETDDKFFLFYLFGKTENVPDTPQEIQKQLDRGSELPINWNAFYSYFEERFNDPHNDYKHQLIRDGYYTAGCGDDVTVMELLEEYRDQLLNIPYDIV